MKYFKFTFLMFAVCLVMSYVSTNAKEIYGIANFVVKAYKLETNYGKYRTKTDAISEQTYENVGTVRLYSDGGYVDINVNLCRKDGKCSGYRTFSTDHKETYTSNNFVLKGDYTLKFKNPNSTACRVSHSGIWTY